LRIEGQERKDAFRYLRGPWGAQDLRRVTVMPKPGWPCSGCCGDAELQLGSERGHRGWRPAAGRYKE